MTSAVLLILPGQGVARLTADEALLVAERLRDAAIDPTPGDNAVRLPQPIDWREDRVTGVDPQ